MGHPYKSLILQVPWAGDGPQVLASLRNLALGLFRMKNVKAIKETAEWVCRDQTRALQFMTT